MFKDSQPQSVNLKHAQARSYHVKISFLQVWGDVEYFYRFFLSKIVGIWHFFSKENRRLEK